MTKLSQTILEGYQVRKTKKQKLAFIDLLRQYFPELLVQEGGFPRCRNIIIGDVENAKLLLSAHYDTCAWLPVPNFIAPKSVLLSLLYSILLAAPVFLVTFLLNLALNFLTDNYWIHYFFSLAVTFGLLSLLFIGPANRHTSNDNTSGVITLCELLVTLTPEQRSKIAFIFFDHEENGLLGSAYFRSKYKKYIQDKLLINFDCVSDGDHILVAANKAARADHAAALDDAFRPIGEKTVVLTKLESTLYPSDQAGFPKAVAVAAMKRKPLIGYYLDRIHTHRDTVFDKENIKLLCESVLRFIKKI